jgi:hypothetical protein
MLLTDDLNSVKRRAREPSLECAEARSLNSWRCTSENLQVIARLDLHRKTTPLPCSEGLRELTNKVHWSTAVAPWLLLRRGGDAWNSGGEVLATG